MLIHRDLLAQATGPDAHDIVHRDALLARLLRTAARPLRNNPLLLGEPGVGKTALIHGLAFRLAHGHFRSPHIARIKEVNVARLALLLADRDLTALDAEQRLLLNERDSLLLFDDARLLLTSGDTTAMLYFLQPLLERPDLCVTLCCGMAEYRRYLEKDPVFSRELEPLQVPELSLEDGQDAVLATLPRTIQRTACRISADTARQATALARRYLPDRALPDKALALLEEAFARVIADGRDQVELTDCKAIVAERTGIPVETLSASDQERLLHLEQELDRQLIGQGHVTRAVSQVIRRARAGLKDPNRPIASFLFLGSSGVGKTELAKVLTRTVYHNERALLRFDMSEFSEPHTVQRLVGAPPGYIGFEEGGQLTNSVLQQPYSLVLLDEIEKAHPKVFDIFLQVMDDGRLTDGKGRTVDFSNCIIIATSNIALERILLAFQENTDVTAKSWYESEVLPLLGNYFRPEFINRFDEVTVFSPFGKDALRQVALLEVEKLKKRLGDLGVELDVDDVRLDAAVERLYNPAFGARPIRRYLQETIENDLAEKLLGQK